LEYTFFKAPSSMLNLFTTSSTSLIEIFQEPQL
jgi:hypothetical protein